MAVESLKKNSYKKDTIYSNLKDEDISFLYFGKEDMTNYVRSFMRINDVNRFKVLDKAVRFGLDVDEEVVGENVPWLFYACEIEDIPLIGKLIQHGANIHKTSDEYGENLIHHCVRWKRPELIKYFIKKGVDVNLVSKENATPIEIACSGCVEVYNKSTHKIHSDLNFDCAMLLLNEPSVKLTREDEDDTLIRMVIRNIIEEDNDYKECKSNNKICTIQHKEQCQRHRDFFKVLLTKFPKFTKKNYVIIPVLLHENKYDVIITILQKYPHLVNKKLIEGKTLMFMALYDSHFEFANTLINTFNIDHKQKDKNGMELLHYLASYGLTDSLKMLISNHKNIQIKKYENQTTIVEHLLTSLNIDDDDKIIDTINFLVEYGHSIEYKMIELAVQYRSWKVVSKLLKLGGNICYDLIKSKEYPVQGNYDILGYAVQIGNYEIVDGLLLHKAPLHKIQVKNHTIHTSVLLAIKFQRGEILSNLLLGTPEIINAITPNVNTFLLDYAIKNGVTDKIILGTLSSDNDIVEVMELDTISMHINHLEKCICRHIPKYTSLNISDKIEFLKLLHMLLNIFSESADLTPSNIFQTFHLVVEFHNFIMSSEYIESNDVDLLLSIISDLSDFYNSRSLKECLTLVYSIETCHLCDFHKKELTNKIKITTKWFAPHENKFIERYNIVCELIKKLLNEKNKDDKDSCSIIVSRNNSLKNDSKNRDVIAIKSLFKLFWPTKVSHYEYMVNNLTNNKDDVLEENEKIVILGQNSVRSTIFKVEDGKVPSRWINTYSPNIGSEEKDDYNHSFSFLLDSKLKNWPCVELTVDDPTHDSGYNKLMYFYGIIQYNGIIETGCYEYFINSYGTLFHRMFRPYGSLQKDIRNKLKI
jgi:ankyrin repeat protein